MANICKYKVEVRGKKNACYAFWASMSSCDDGTVLKEEGDDDNYILRFLGFCKWSVNAYCNPFKGKKPVQLPSDPDEAFSLAMDKYWYYTVQERSEMFQVEVFCCSNDIDDFWEEGEEYQHYINGSIASTEDDFKMHEELKITPDWY